jgi:hypothetical protein
MITLRFACAAALLFSSMVIAQSAPVTPPPDALIPDAPRLRLAIAGQQFQWSPQDSGRAAPGATSRVTYSEGGLVTADLSTGASDAGAWTVTGSKLCVQWRTFPSGCNEVRISQDTLWLHYSDGRWSSMRLLRKDSASPSGR